MYWNNNEYETPDSVMCLHSSTQPCPGVSVQSISLRS